MLLYLKKTLLCDFCMTFLPFIISSLNQWIIAAVEPCHRCDIGRNNSNGTDASDALAGRLRSHKSPPKKNCKCKRLSPPPFSYAPAMPEVVDDEIKRLVRATCDSRGSNFILVEDFERVFRDQTELYLPFRKFGWDCNDLWINRGCACDCALSLFIMYIFCILQIWKFGGLPRKHPRRLPHREQTDQRRGKESRRLRRG